MVENVFEKLQEDRKQEIQSHLQSQGDVIDREQKLSELQAWILELFCQDVFEPHPNRFESESGEVDEQWPGEPKGSREAILDELWFHLHCTIPAVLSHRLVPEGEYESDCLYLENALVGLVERGFLEEFEWRGVSLSDYERAEKNVIDNIPDWTVDDFPHWNDISPSIHRGLRLNSANAIED
jgi:hypothetical protein